MNIKLSCLVFSMVLVAWSKHKNEGQTIAFLHLLGSSTILLDIVHCSCWNTMEPHCVHPYDHVTLLFLLVMFHVSDRCLNIDISRKNTKVVTQSRSKFQVFRFQPLCYRVLNHRVYCTIVNLSNIRNICLYLFYKMRGNICIRPTLESARSLTCGRIH